jgi:hypothetical protein
LLEIYRGHLIVACAAHFAGVLSFEDLISWHGTKPIFKSTSSSTQLDSWAPIGQSYLFQVIGAPQSARLSKALTADITNLEIIGSVLLRSRTPWASKPDFTMRFIDWVTGLTAHLGPPPTEMPSLSPDALFAAFVLAASAMEAIEQTKLSSFVIDHMSPRGVQLGLLDPLRRLLFSRISEQNRQELDAELAAAALTTPQADLVLRWVTGQVNFIRHHGKRPRSQAE